MNKIYSFKHIKDYIPTKLTEETHLTLLQCLKYFKRNSDKNKLLLNYEYDNLKYGSIVEKMNRIGILAQSIQHHPEWTLSANSLKICLTTHDIGNNISTKDYILGNWIQTILYEKSFEDTMLNQWNQNKFDISQLN